MVDGRLPRGGLRFEMCKRDGNCPRRLIAQLAALACVRTCSRLLSGCERSRFKVTPLTFVYSPTYARYFGSSRGPNITAECLHSADVLTQHEQHLHGGRAKEQELHTYNVGCGAVADRNCWCKNKERWALLLFRAASQRKGRVQTEPENVAKFLPKLRDRSAVCLYAWRACHDHYVATRRQAKTAIFS